MTQKLKAAKNRLRTRETLAARRAREIRERKLKEQVDSWFGAPLRDAISNQAQALEDVNKSLQINYSDFLGEFLKVKDLVAHLEQNLANLISTEVAAAVTGIQGTGDQVRSDLEDQVTDLSGELSRLKDTVSQDREKQAVDFDVFYSNATRRLNDAEYTIRELQDSKVAVDKLTLEFDVFSNNERQLEAYTRRLEFLIKDMERRMWPWREQMDRSNSPPPVNTQDKIKPDWMPWPPYRPVKTSPTTSYGSIPSLSAVQRAASPPPSDAWPTPPTSTQSTSRAASCCSPHFIDVNIH